MLYWDESNQYPTWFMRCRYRKTCASSSSLYDLEKDAYRAWEYDSKIHLDFIDNKAYGNVYEQIYHLYNSNRNSGSSSLQCYKESDHRSLTLSPRYIYHDGYVYCQQGQGYGFLLLRGKISEGKYSEVLWGDAGMMMLETTNYGHSEASYDYDFFLGNGNNGKKILVFLSFAGSGNYSAKGLNYSWSSTYCNWNVNYATLLVQSLAIPDEKKNFYRDTPGTGDLVQNVIYVAPYSRASGNYVDVRNTSKGQVYRLYQNTHRMCQYISPKVINMSYTAIVIPEKNLNCT